MASPSPSASRDSRAPTASSSARSAEGPAQSIRPVDFLEPVCFSDGRVVHGIGVNVSTTGILWPDLSVDIDDNAEAILELEDVGDAVVLAVVTLRHPVEASTANLFAPIIINVRRGLGVQFVPNAQKLR